MVLELVDQQLQAMRQRGDTPTRIRIGAEVAPVFIAEMTKRGATLPPDGKPVEYNGVAIAMDALDPKSVVIETD